MEAPARELAERPCLGLATRHRPGSRRGTGLAWLDSATDVLAFRRGERLVCQANLSPVLVALPPHERVILASGPLTDGALPPDTAAWLHTVH